VQLSQTLAWLVDEAGAAPDADRFLAELGARLVGDVLPLAGGPLTLAVPHPLIARRTWLRRSDSGAVIEALGFAAAGLPGAAPAGPPGDVGRGWLEALARGPVHEDVVGPATDGPSLGWIGPRCSLI
jgi:adenylate cyclase